MFFQIEDVPEEYELEVGRCPICHGVIGVDATFLDQVDSTVTCPFCENGLMWPEDEVSDVEADVIAASYEWVCPCCGMLHRQVEWTQWVRCGPCRKAFRSAPPRHAIE